MLTDTNNCEHFILQITTEKVSSETIYIFVIMKFCKQITKLQKRDLFFSKI